MKTCTKCNQPLELKFFRLRDKKPRTNPHFRSWCIPCVNERRILRKYGINRSQFQALYDQQSGCCAICLVDFTSTPYVDHEHATGAVRGLLCQRCNSALGLFQENPLVVARASDYVNQFYD